jgi:hypothetical protein
MSETGPRRFAASPTPTQLSQNDDPCGEQSIARRLRHDGRRIDNKIVKEIVAAALRPRALLTRAATRCEPERRKLVREGEGLVCTGEVKGLKTYRASRAVQSFKHYRRGRAGVLVPVPASNPTTQSDRNCGGQASRQSESIVCAIAGRSADNVRKVWVAIRHPSQACSPNVP